MQKEVGEELPDPEPVHHRIRHESKPLQPKFPSCAMENEFGKLLEDEDADARNTKRLDGAGEIAAQVKAVAAIATGEGAHRPQV